MGRDRVNRGLGSPFAVLAWLLGEPAGAQVRHPVDSADTVVTSELTADVRDRAIAVLPVEPVRTVGALHLATALEFAEAFPDVALLSLDRRVRENAEEFGVPLVG